MNHTHPTAGDNYPKATNDAPHGVGHIVPFKLLLAVFVALVCLTVLTVAASLVNFGPMNLVVALFIAVVKASLVVLFFMHLIWDKPFNAIVFIGCLIFVGLFISLALLDSGQYLPSVYKQEAPGIVGQDGKVRTLMTTEAPEISRASPALRRRADERLASIYQRKIARRPSTSTAGPYHATARSRQSPPPSPPPPSPARDFREPPVPAPADGDAPAREIHIPGAGTIGMVVLIISLSTLFIASMFAYVYIRNQSDGWPPAGLPHVPRSLWFSTAAILAASVTIQMALNAVKRDDDRGLTRYLLATFVAGLLFLLLQSLNWIEFYRALIAVTRLEGAYLGMFFILTGLHAAHVVGGLIPLGMVYAKARKGVYSRNFHPGVRYVAVYWHFLDVIWVVLFSLIYF